MQFSRFRIAAGVPDSGTNIVDVLARVRVLFTSAVVALLVGLFLLSVPLRSGELALLGTAGRFISSIGYRTQYALGALFAPIRADAREESARAVPVLVYHGIVRDPDRFSLSEEQFKEQLFALKRAGYETITVGEFLAFHRGERELPDKSFLLTFDDGRRDSFERADSILRALGYTAVMFVATDASLGPEENHNDYYLNERDLRLMVRNGRWEIGSHALQIGGGQIPISASDTGNFLSNKMWLSEEARHETDAEYAARIEREIVESKRVLEQRFDIPVSMFSYPYGDYGQQSTNFDEAESVIAPVVARTYDAAFQQVWPEDNDFGQNYPGTNPVYLRRIEPATDWNGRDIVSVLEKTRPKPIPYIDEMNDDRGWKYNWGTAEIASGRLALSANDTSNGAFAFLDGTYDWRDVAFRAQVSDRSGFASLITRYADGDNMALCTFGDDTARVDQRVNGENTRLAEVRANIPESAEFEIRAIGARVHCVVDDTIVASAAIDPSLVRGGIALRAWNETAGSAGFTVEHIEVANDVPIAPDTRESAPGRTSPTERPSESARATAASADDTYVPQTSETQLSPTPDQGPSPDTPQAPPPAEEEEPTHASSTDDEPADEERSGADDGDTLDEEIWGRLRDILQQFNSDRGHNESESDRRGRSGENQSRREN